MSVSARFRRLLKSLLLLLVIALQATPAQAQTLYLTGEGVRLRSSPSLQAPVLRTLHYRTAVKKLHRDREFQKILTPDGVTGYIHAAYASITVPPPRQRLQQTDQKACIVWMNTRTWVYHDDSCRWFGNTRYGQYMACRDAAKQGRPCGICDPPTR